jgi:hypothetical protein
LKIEKASMVRVKIDKEKKKKKKKVNNHPRRRRRKRVINQCTALQVFQG